MLNENSFLRKWHYCILVLSLSLVLSTNQCIGFVIGNPRLSFKQQCSNTNNALTITSSSKNDNNEQEQLLEKANELRKQASELEAKLRTEKKDSKAGEIEKSSAPGETIISYERIADSTWIIKYLFSSTPPSKDDPDAIIENYRGKFSVTFQPDGYTQLNYHEGAGDSNRRLEISKAWGWDQEISDEDGKTYLLFSMDATIPKTKTQQRFYLQARIEKENNNKLILKEGTVTVKQDVVESTPGFFGLFSMKGILAQFRIVGQFTSIPTSL